MKIYWLAYKPKRKGITIYARAHSIVDENKVNRFQKSVAQPIAMRRAR